ncbi:MAG: alpha/beta hydrolase domain-containing protein [Planctomycetaceae bacterium]
MRFPIIPRRPIRVLAALLFIATLALDVAALADVTGIEITSREPFENGREFGDRGAYEVLNGRVRFAVDPRHQANATVVDLDLAPKNEAGLVEFAADLRIIAPRDLSKSNGAILYDVNNRGNLVSLGMFNGGADGFLMRQGYIIVSSGWIAEVVPGNDRLILDAPVATQDGRPITGPIRAEFVSDSDVPRKTIAHFDNQGSYPPTERGLKEATLTRRLRERDPREPIPRDEWRLHQRYIEEDGRRSALPIIEAEIAGGIRAGYIYELIYEGHGPIVQGLGLAGIRDLVGFLKRDHGAGNPLRHGERSVAKYAYGFGVSQSGRALRMFLYDGFNADERGRKVFDGVIPHVAGGGMGFFNHRFASPTRHNAQHDNHQYPADVFPFTYGLEQDRLSAALVAREIRLEPEPGSVTVRVDGILRAATAANVVPKIMHFQTSSEYWHRAGSLVHTDPQGTKDSEIPPEVRIYTAGGAQHGPGTGLPMAGGNGRLPRNPTDYRPLNRAILVALDRWVREGVEPPPSVYPKIADGTLVDWPEEKSGWKRLPGVSYPRVIHQPDLIDRGPQFFTKRITSIQPPKVVGRYVVKVPAYGPDDDERGCLLLPTVAVPVATFTSWNLRTPEIGAEDELLSLFGGYIPFARTANERSRANDPRESLLERYGDFETYRRRFEEHAAKLVADGYLLEEDAPRLHKLAEANRPLFGAGRDE